MKTFIYTLLVVGASAMAQAETLTWQQAVQEAVQSNPDVLMAEKAVSSANSLKRASYHRFLPELTASATDAITQAPGESSLLGPGSVANYGAYLTFNQNLFSGFRDVGRVNEARANMAVEEANLQKARAKLLYDLRCTFAQFLTAQEQLKLGEDILHRRKQNSAMVDLRYQVGRENKGSYQLTVGLVHEAELTLEQTQLWLDIQRRTLANLLGRESAADLNLVGELKAVSLPPQPDFAHLAESTPDEKMAQAQRQLAQSKLQQARAGYFPELKLSANVGESGTTWYPHDQHGWSVTLILDLPLFRGGRTFYESQSARSNLQRAELNQTQALRTALLRLQQAYMTFSNLRKRVQVEQELLEATATRAMIARAKYTQGLMSFDDWSIVENDLIDRQKSILERKRDLALAEADWYQQLGSTEGL